MSSERRLAALAGHIGASGGHARPSEHPTVFVGAMVMDVKCSPSAGHAPRPGTSVPGRIVQTPGGVARNVAEVYAALAARDGAPPPLLISAVADDPTGRALVAHWASGLGLDARGVRVVASESQSQSQQSPHRTCAVAAFFGSDGELACAIADAALAESAIDDAWVASFAADIARAPLCLLDANLSPGAMARVYAIAAESGTPIWLETCSEPKAGRGARLLRRSQGNDGCNTHKRPVLIVSPNAGELRALAAAVRAGDESVIPESGILESGIPWPALLSDAEAVLAAGATAVMTHCGAEGACLSVNGPGGEVDHTHLPATPVSRICNASGAGDTLAAGAARAFVRGGGM